MDAQPTNVGGTLTEDERFQADLQRALELSKETERMDEFRRQARRSGSSPRTSESTFSSIHGRPLPPTPPDSDGPDSVPARPPDLMSFQFDHVLRKYDSQQSPGLQTKREEGLKAANVLTGKNLSGVNFAQTSSRPIVPSLQQDKFSASYPGLSSSPRNISSNTQYLQEDRSSVDPTGTKSSPFGDDFLTGANPVAFSGGVSTNPFLTPASVGPTTVGSHSVPDQSFSVESTPTSSATLIKLDPIQSLQMASLESFSSSSQGAHKISASSLSGFSSGPGRKSSGNPFKTNTTQPSLKSLMTSGQGPIQPPSSHSQNIRRISSQPSFPEYLSNSTRPKSELDATVCKEWPQTQSSSSCNGTIRHSHSTEILPTEKKSPGSDLMTFSPRGSHCTGNDEVFDFKDFDPLNTPPKLEPKKKKVPTATLR